MFLLYICVNICSHSQQSVREYEETFGTLTIKTKNKFELLFNQINKKYGREEIFNFKMN